MAGAKPARGVPERNLAPEIGDVAAMTEHASLSLSQADELHWSKADFIGIKREQSPLLSVSEHSKDLGHRIEGAFRHGRDPR
ncbi:hypothetical protein [Edaphobacter modestus]|uniref:hypothetical protein n=1 Tax=Edaphobacter modestus TaxID=388466 RepID=UPI00102AB89C|nr:hypothetical protein [Edaphobacter modestus]